MSVEKFKVTKEDSGYTTLPNAPLQAGIDLAALGLWCSLASRPPSFVFYKDQIQSHFHIGRDKLLRLIGILKSMNLIEIKAIKNSKGQIKHWDLKVKNGDSFIHTTENTDCGKTTLLKNQALENQGLVSADYKRKKEKIKKDIKKDFILPEWLSLKDWNDFLEHRIKLKAPLSENAKLRLIKSLQKLKDKGGNVTEIINESIVQGWKGVFPIRSNHNQGAKNANKRKSATAIHFDSCKPSLKGTIYGEDYKPEDDPFGKKTD